MAENTRLRDLQNDVKTIFKRLDKRDLDTDTRIAQVEAANASSMDRIEAALHTLVQLVTSPHGGSNSNYQKAPFQVRNVKLEFTRFDGKDALEWIFKVEQFIEYYETPDIDRLTITDVHLDQEVISWFQMMQRNQPFQSWQAFTRTLELDFEPSLYDCPRATLSKLTQTGYVNQYYMEFTSLANQVYGLSPDALLDCFISGLQPDLRRDLMAQCPIFLPKVVALAKLFEEKYRPNHKPPTTSHKTPYTYTNYQTRYTTNNPSNSPHLQKNITHPTHQTLLPTP